MGNLTRYHAADLPQLLERINKNSIGMEDFFDGFFNATTDNYPPYNLVSVNNIESKLEIALAGFKKEEVAVYTEYGKLFVEGKKENTDTETEYHHRGIAQRSFKRSWSISDDVEIRSVEFQDGLLSVRLGKIIPEHHARKDWL